MGLHLVIANKRYSSWSLRPWLVATVFGIPFEETLIPLDLPETRAQILAHSPSGRVPCLTDGDVRIWESLAIIEYLAERFAEHPIWPRNVAARALARAVSCEMHAGFATLRSACPMDLSRTPSPGPDNDKAAADVARIVALRRDCRARFGDGGPFLFGAFSAADAMYAPVATRLVHYGFALEPDTQAYVDAIYALPAMRRWVDEAAAEPWFLPDHR